MKQYLKLSLSAVLLMIFTVPVAMAELNVDSRAIYDRMDRLERDITLLQRRIYKSNTQQTDTASTTQINASEGSLQHLYAKINEQEHLLAQMTSQMEELSHQLTQLQEDLKRMNADVDFRFNEMKTVTSSVPVAVVNAIETPAETPVAQEMPKDAKSAYNAAYDLLKQLKYEQAEVALQDFLKTYPDDELAGNAQYWLGETYYVRGQYEPAAVAFATGFKNYKKSTKGADNLLKLGLSMQQLGKKKEACTAFKNLKKEFPKSSALVLSRAQKEMDKLGCDK